MNSKQRAQRVRYKLRSVNNGRIRLSVFKSLQHIYVQAIDDSKHTTLASYSTIAKDFSGSQVQKKEQAKIIGQTIAKKLIDLNIKNVYLDRGHYSYSGLIKELADAARESGLNF